MKVSFITTNYQDGVLKGKIGFTTPCEMNPSVMVGSPMCQNCPNFINADYTNNIVECRRENGMKKRKADFVLIGIILGLLLFWGLVAFVLSLIF